MSNTRIESRKSLGVRNLLLLVVVAALVRAPARAFQSAPTPPPDTLACNSYGIALYKNAAGSLGMRASYNLTACKVNIDLSSYTSGQGSSLHRHDEYALRYWPTSVVQIDSLKLAVAGKSRRSGNTIIEIWTFATPSVPAAQVPGQPPAITGGALETVEEVYSESTSGRELVQRMMPLWGGAHTRLLVQFVDSKDVYSLDAVTGQVALVASPVTKPGALKIALLTSVQACSAGELATGGFVYRFRIVPPPVNQPSNVLLRDADKDGVIEGFELLTAAEFEQRGYCEASAWIR